MKYLPVILWVVIAGPITVRVVWQCYQDIQEDLRELRRLRSEGESYDQEA